MLQQSLYRMKGQRKALYSVSSNCRQSDSRTSTREHTSSLLWILISLRVKAQIFLMVWALLPLHLQLSPTLLPAHSQLFPWPHQTCCHLQATAPAVPSPRFSTGSSRPPPRCNINSETFPDYPAWNSNPHSLPTPVPPTLPVPLCWFIVLHSNLLPLACSTLTCFYYLYHLKRIYTAGDQEL